MILDRKLLLKISGKYNIDRIIDDCDIRDQQLTLVLKSVILTGRYSWINALNSCK